jgi:hypothetical protein
LPKRFSDSFSATGRLGGHIARQTSPVAYNIFGCEALPVKATLLLKQIESAIIMEKAL